jgi:methylated-DNA-[protein]-cysteine S-methyltransferase
MEDSGVWAPLVSETLMSYSAQSTVLTPLGDMLLACTPRGLAGAWFLEGQKDTPDALEGVPYRPQDSLLSEAAEQISAYWQGQLQRFSMPLDLIGTAFQVSVWQHLLNIGHGQHQTYGDVARALGSPKGFRAVGMAVGRNPLSIVVPCHRVMGQDGWLTGYSGGLHRKVALLQHEGVALDGQRVLAQPAA